MAADQAQEYFTWTALGGVAAGVAAVNVVTNTVRNVFGISFPWIPLLISMIIVFVYSYTAQRVGSPEDLLLVILNGCLLYATATGTQEVIVAGGQPAISKGYRFRRLPWFSSWLRDR